MRIDIPKNLAAICLCFGLASVCSAQNAPITQTPDQQKPAAQAAPPPAPTPTFQYGSFFLRGNLSYVHVSDITPGFAFGQGGVLKNQPRAVAEFGFLF
jgi:hypothetical protein